MVNKMVTKKQAPNENLLKLRELSEELSNKKSDDTTDYSVIVKKLKTIVDSGKKEIEGSKTPQSKIKCYESMCTTITTLLNNVNII